MTVSRFSWAFSLERRGRQEQQGRGSNARQGEARSGLNESAEREICYAMRLSDGDGEESPLDLVALEENEDGRALPGHATNILPKPSWFRMQRSSRIE